MKAIFTIVWRLLVIVVGLTWIAAGGTCVLVGVGEGASAQFVVLIGLVSTGVGLAIVLQTIWRWRRESKNRPPDSFANKEHE